MTLAGAITVIATVVMFVQLARGILRGRVPLATLVLSFVFTAVVVVFVLARVSGPLRAFEELSYPAVRFYLKFGDGWVDARDVPAWVCGAGFGSGLAVVVAALALARSRRGNASASVPEQERQGQGGA